jgi:hypothetical protein
VLQADVRGVFAQVFCDFGPAFEVLDVDGGWLPCCRLLPLPKLIFQQFDSGLICRG